MHQLQIACIIVVATAIAILISVGVLIGRYVWG